MSITRVTVFVSVLVLVLVSCKNPVTSPSIPIYSTQVKLTDNDGAADDNFGLSVAISGNTAIVGASSDDDNGAGSGSAYLFQRDSSNGFWYQYLKLTAADGAVLDGFGISVAISSDAAIVGAYGDDDNGNSSGSAYIFQRDAGGWIQVQKLTAADGAAGDSFGYSVAISGDTAIVGAYYDDDNGADFGSAYIFQRDAGAWSQVQKLTAADGATEDFFGYSVAISGDAAIVGAYRDDDNGSNSGSAYLFQRDSSNGFWYQYQKLSAADGAANDYFWKFRGHLRGYCHRWGLWR